MKTNPRRTSACKRLGLVITWLGIFALMIPGPDNFPNPSLIMLPAGIALYAVGWIRKE